MQIRAQQPQPNERPRDIAGLRSLNIGAPGTEGTHHKVHPVGVLLAPRQDVFGVGASLSQRDRGAGARAALGVAFGAARRIDGLAALRDG